jgi:hypothetical protein
VKTKGKEKLPNLSLSLSLSLTSTVFFRFIEWIDCCCAGSTENTQNAGELLFPVSSVIPCRDTMFQHPRTKSCDLLAQLPSSIPLDSGYHIVIHLFIISHIFIIISIFFSTSQSVFNLIDGFTFLNRIYAQTLITHQPSWLNFSSITTEPSVLQVSIPLKKKKGKGKEKEKCYMHRSVRH